MKWLHMCSALFGFVLLIGVSSDPATTKLTEDTNTISVLEAEPGYEDVEVEIPDYEGKTFDVRQEVTAGLKLLRDLNSYMTSPTPNGFFTVMPQLGPLAVLGGLGKIAGVVGGILDELFPGPSNEDVIREIQRTFTLLYNKMAVIRSDIRALERVIKWENTRLRYGAVVDIIKTAVELNMRIRTATSEAEKRRRQDRFVEHCFSQGLLNAVNTLYNGIIGRGAFTHNVLENYYTESRGHRTNIQKLGGRLVQLATGGLLSLMSYEAVRRGQGGADDMAKDYQERMQATGVTVKGASDKCDREIGQNMLLDMQDWMNQNPRLSVRDTAMRLHTHLQAKYDWKWLNAMSYTQNAGDHRQPSRNHASKGGPAAGWFNLHGKHTIIAYVDKRSSTRVRQAQPVVDAATVDNAKSAVDQIDAQLRSRSISSQWIFAVRKRGISSHIHYYSNVGAASLNGSCSKLAVIR